MLHQELIGELYATEQFFRRSVSAFAEEDSGFHPAPGMKTVSGHVAHVARTVDWFVEGTFRPEGFDMDFERHDAEANACESLAAALDWVGRSFEAARKAIEAKSEAELRESYPEGSLMKGPKYHMLGGIVDHTAHHRGALTVYARLLGKVAPMPYM